MPETPVITDPVVQEPAAATPGSPKPAEPATPAVPKPAAAPLHEDPVIAKALEGLTEEQRQTLLTTGGKNALAARLEETKAAKAQAATAAETARTELAQQIGKALGLVKDEPLDPAKLTEELTAEKFAAQRARIELAVYQTASAAKGDPAALLDSQSFLASLKDIDPTDSAAIQAAVESAVEANPRLGVATGPRLPAPNPAIGSSGAGAPVAPGQLTDADMKSMYAAKDYAGIEKARSEGRLNTVLGI